MKIFFTSLFLFGLVFLFTENIHAFDAPIGVPDPGWGYDEVVPNRPDSWTAEIAGYYYINYETGTDTGRTYGTPSEPRKTIPNPMPEGSRVEVAGNYNQYSSNVTFVQGAGTAENPVWIVGSDITPGVFNYRTYFYGTYLYVKNLNFKEGTGIRGSGYTAHHIMVRDSNITKTDAIGIIIVGTDAVRINQIIFDNNVIHDTSPRWNVPDINQDGIANDDCDYHGISIGSYSEYIWVTNNAFQNIAGNAIQVNGGTDGLENLHHIYFSHNIVSATRQSSVGIKKSSDVIISENILSDAREIYNGLGNYCAGVSYQYSPQRLWIINNTIFDADHGVKSGGGLSPAGDYAYVIGNLIYNIHTLEARGDHYSSWVLGSAIRNFGVQHNYTIGNTIFDADHGITGAGLAIIHHIENNIISDINWYHILFDYAFTAENSNFNNNLLYQEEDGEKLYIAGHGGLISLSNYPFGTGNISTNPQFVDALNNNFTLRPASPAKDAGILSDVYTEFYNRYGISINQDISGTSRPANGVWDIGAYEYEEGNTIRADVDNSGGITTADALLTLRNSLGLDMAGTAWQVSSTTGDVNCNGESNSADALLILRYSLGLGMSETAWCEGS